MERVRIPRVEKPNPGDFILVRCREWRWGYAGEDSYLFLQVTGCDHDLQIGGWQVCTFQTGYKAKTRYGSLSVFTPTMEIPEVDAVSQETGDDPKYNRHLLESQYKVIYAFKKVPEKLREIEGDVTALFSKGDGRMSLEDGQLYVSLDLVFERWIVKLIRDSHK